VREHLEDRVPEHLEGRVRVHREDRAPEAAEPEAEVVASAMRGRLRPPLERRT